MTRYDSAAETDEAQQETDYLFSSPANAQRLFDADAALRRGEGTEIELDRD